MRRDALYVSVGGLAMDESATVGRPNAEPHEHVSPIGTETTRDVPATADLFDPATTGRVVVMQCIVPLLATIGSYATFATIGPI